MFDNAQTPTGNLVAKILKTAYHCLLRILMCMAVSSNFGLYTPNLVKHNIASMSAAAKSRSRLVTFIDINTAKCDS